ncbi:MAG: hypothetical protein OEY70_14590 [Acidimicrobiia bacterium]|nr:hypothetical protein [Acidimicrobiia bacterium]
MPRSPSTPSDPWPPPFPGPPRPAPGPVPPIVRLRLRLRRRGRHRAALVTLALFAGGLAGAGWAGAGPLAAALGPVRALTGPHPAAGDAPADAAGEPRPGTGAGPSPGPAVQVPSSPAAERLGLRPGERAVALAVPAALPPVEPGDEVELVAVAVDNRGTVAAEPLAAMGRVLAVGDNAVTVALPAADAVTALRHQAEGPMEFLLR